MKQEGIFKCLEKDTASGKITVQLNEEKPVTFDSVSLHSFGEGKGGYMSGGEDGIYHYIAFGYPDGLKDGSYEIKYKDGFSGDYMNWAYNLNNGKRYEATEGTLNVTFTKGLSVAAGSYSFVTEDNDTVRGTFDLKR
ncbi:hypothetical protein [Pseudomonas sp. RT6P73]